MPYLVHKTFSLGSSNAGQLSDMRAQPVTLAKVNTGPVITDGFFEIGLGDYGWSGNVPDDARFILGYRNSDPTAVHGIPIEPPAGSTVVGEGANLISVEVVDTDDDEIVAASVRLTGPALLSNVTDSLGVARFGVLNGNYFITVAKFGYASVPPVAITVNANATHTVTLTPIVVPDVVAGRTPVLVVITNSSGDPVRGESIKYRAINENGSLTDWLYSPSTGADGTTTFQVLSDVQVDFQYGDDEPERVDVTTEQVTLQYIA